MKDPYVIEHRRTRDRHGRGPARIGVNLTSMIDVVFLLLVYFMVATEFKLGEEVYRLDLPDRAASAQQDPFELDDEPLRILVSTVGFDRDGYRLRIDGPYPQPSSFEQLFEFLRDRRIGSGAPNAQFQPDNPILIEPARSARWEHAMEAFNAAVRARYTNVTFAKPGRGA